MNVEQRDHYDFIVTGASGNVGRHLIPLLASRGHRILAVGRDVTMLRVRYAGTDGVKAADYDDLTDQPTCDTMIHLAVRNNNQPGALDDFSRVNINFAMSVCREFTRMGGRRFVNLSSIQSLDDDNSSPYAVSKELARRRIGELIGDQLDNIYIGYFHSRHYYGDKLAFLGRLGFFGDALFGLFKALKPTTSAESLANYVSDPDQTIPPPRILTDDLERSWPYRSVTRVLDLMVSFGVLTALLPIFTILWMLIRLDSPGSAVFKQTRVGKGKTLFTLYKFRSMKIDTVSVGTHEVNLSATTKIGRFLRRTKLDELPQAINLLRGEMTLVGPRPCLPVQEGLIDARTALGVYAMKPGITGYAQIQGIDMSRPQKLASSEYVYMKLQSLTFNFKIILQTAFGRGRGDRVASPCKS